MTHSRIATFARQLRPRPLHVLLMLSLTACPYIGSETHDNNVGDDDSEDIDDDSQDIDDDSQDLDSESGTDSVDSDNDGVPASEDCDDEDANNYPGNTEVCDGSDNNCDLEIDEGFPPLYLDRDDDGYGGALTDACNTTDRTTETPGDCDDTKPEVFPGNPEVCDTLDNDCNDSADDGLPPRYVDNDNDGYGAGTPVSCDSTQPTSTLTGDCDDGNRRRFPGSEEFCDGIDNDCTSVTSDDGVATLFPANGNPPRNLLTTPDANTVVANRSDNAEVRFCQGGFAMTFVFQNNTGNLLMSGLGDVDLRPRVADERVIYIEDSRVQLNNVTIADGGDVDVGSGVLCLDGQVVLNAVAFNDNVGSFGTALFASNCDVSGSDVHFVNNTAIADGSSIVHAELGSTVTLTDPLWRDNTGDLSLYLNNADSTLADALFADSTRGGIFMTGEAELSISNGQFADNAGTDLSFSDFSGFNLGSNATISCSSPSNTCVAR